MKRRMPLSLMLTTSMLLWLVSLPATAQAAPPPERFFKDAGVVTPGLGQLLRITISPSTIPNGAGTGAISVRMRWMQYGPQGCSGMPQVCRHMVVSQGATPVETVGPDDAISMDVQGTGGVRVIVESDSRNARVVVQIIDIATGKVISVDPTDNMT